MAQKDHHLRKEDGADEPQEWVRLELAGIFARNCMEVGGGLWPWEGKGRDGFQRHTVFAGQCLPVRQQGRAACGLLLLLRSFWSQKRPDPAAVYHWPWWTPSPFGKAWCDLACRSSRMAPLSQGQHHQRAEANGDDTGKQPGTLQNPAGHVLHPGAGLQA